MLICITAFMFFKQSNSCVFNMEAAICCGVSKIYMRAGYLKIFSNQPIKAGFSPVKRVYVIKTKISTNASLVTLPVYRAGGLYKAGVSYMSISLPC